MLKQESTDCFSIQGHVVNILGFPGQPVCQCRHSVKAAVEVCKQTGMVEFQYNFKNVVI